MQEQGWGVVFFLATLAAACAGAWIGKQVKIPAGAMLGAMVGVAVFHIFTGWGRFPSELKTVVQILSGALIGSKVSRKDVAALKKILLPTAILLLFMTLMNLTLGISIYKLGGLDIATALFSASPGGLTDMALLAEELGANSTYVTLLQLVRLLTIFSFLPPIIKRVLKKQLAAAQARGEAPAEPTVQPRGLSRQQQLCYFAETMLAAAIGGLALHFLHVTAGAMLGSMLAVAAWNIATGRGYFPRPVSDAAQVASGALLGLKIDMTSVLGLAGLAVPALLVMAGVLLFSLLTGYVMHRLTRLDLATCLLASTPGGLTEMSLLSEDLGADTPKIAVMQTARLLYVVAFFPTMIEFVAHALG